VGVQQPYEVYITDVVTEHDATDVKIGPNPTTTYVEVFTKREVTLKLYDVSGKQVLVTNDKVLNVETLVVGTYFLTVTENGVKIKTYKLMKMQSH